MLLVVLCRYWTGNQDTDKVLQLLGPIKKKYPTLSWADLIVLAGTTAVEQAAADPNGYKFCGGRTDASDAKGTEHLGPRNYTTVAIKASVAVCVAACWISNCQWCAAVAMNGNYLALLENNNHIRPGSS